jgi:hypothetical protein
MAEKDIGCILHLLEKNREENIKKALKNGSVLLI